MLKLKRAYEKPSPDDGERILVDRLWPRGLKKEAAHLDDWLKELAPSDELRHWFAHDPERWEEFQQRYIEELEESDNKSPIEELRQKARQGPVTLVFAAKDEEKNNAVVLKKFLEQRLGS